MTSTKLIKNIEKSEWKAPKIQVEIDFAGMSEGDVKKTISFLRNNYNCYRGWSKQLADILEEQI